MNVPVLIEKVNNDGYRARSGEPLPLTAEGTTREEAVKNLRTLIDLQLATGSELIQLEVQPDKHPLAKYAGTWSPDDPVIQKWKELVEEYRRERDEEPDS